jgi:antitoxin (DNA-binding transcriptional repressor) of toxin-antitoxin stability system
VHKRKPAKTKVGIRNFRSDLSGFIRRAASGEVIVLTSHDKQVAELHPPAPWSQPVRRKPGTLKGRIKMAPDFDKLPDDLLDAFES